MKLLKKQTRSWNYPIVGGITVLFILLLVAGLYLTQTVLLENAQELGNEVASRCSQEELSSAQTAQSLLLLGNELLEEQVAAGAYRQALLQWTDTFLTTVSQWLGSDALVPQGVIQGTLVSPTVPAGTTPPEDLPWYQQAMARPGEMIYTAPTLDETTGESVLTLAQWMR